MENQDRSDTKGDNRSTHVTGNVINSPLLSGNFHGSVTTSFSGHTTVNIGDSITINKEYLQSMPQEYAASLEQLARKINEELKNEKLPPEKVAPLQESANDLAKELSDVNQPEKVPFEKKNKIGTKLVRFGKAIVRASPKIAQMVVAMTPLAPISALVGETFDRIVQDTLEEGPQ